MTNPDDAANELEYLSDEDIIDDNANYVDEDFGSSLPPSFAIDNTVWTESQERIEWVNPYGNTDDLDTLSVELPDHEPWDVASQDGIDFNDVITPINASNWKIIRHVRNRESNWMTQDTTKFIRRTVKERTKFMPKPWQVSVMSDIVYENKDVVVSAGTGSGKSLPYQLLPLIKKDAIVLVISPTIALVADQCQSLLDLNITAVALTAETTDENPQIWSKINKGFYSVILASPEILLPHGSPFWLQIMNDRLSAFNRRIACFVIDDAHLMWGWRDFRKQYGNLDKLRTYFPRVPIMAVSATITRNVLEYIRVTLHLHTPVHLYQRSLDRPNITYMVQEIKRKGFQELDILLPSGEAAAVASVFGIPQTMIFVDKINEGILIAEYLQSLLPQDMSHRAKEIIRPFYSNLQASTREDFMDDFRLGNTRILVCAEAAGMGVNIQNVARVIQWKIADHLVLAALVQRIGRAGRDKTLPAVAIIFVESKHFLRDDVALNTDSPFRELTTAIGSQDSERAKEIVSTLYENNHQNKKSKAPTPYHAIDPAILWLINTTGCRRYLVLACFLSDSFFQGTTHTACCDCCMYDEWDENNTDIPVFERHEITARHCRRYLRTIEYQQAQSRINAAKRTTRPRTNKGDQDACIEALTLFAKSEWPRGMHELMFPRSLMQRIATAAVRIKSVEDLRNELGPTHNLATGSLRAHASDIVSILQITIFSDEQESLQPIEGQNTQNDEIDQNQATRGQAPRDRDSKAEESWPRARGRPRGGGPPRGHTGGYGGGDLMDWTA